MAIRTHGYTSRKSVTSRQSGQSLSYSQLSDRERAFLWDLGLPVTLVARDTNGSNLDISILILLGGMSFAIH